MECEAHKYLWRPDLVRMDQVQHIWTSAGRTQSSKAEPGLYPAPRAPQPAWSCLGSRSRHQQLSDLQRLTKLRHLRVVGCALIDGIPIGQAIEADRDNLVEHLTHGPHTLLNM